MFIEMFFTHLVNALYYETQKYPRTEFILLSSRLRI